MEFLPSASTSAPAEGGFDDALFASLAEVEPRSFWFRARNRLIVSTVRRHFPSAESMLEVGSGTGFVLAALHERFPALRLVGLEPYAAALPIAQGRVPSVELFQCGVEDLPFQSEFDIVGAFDVLEHIEDDGRALAAMHRALKPGGGVVLLVPQHPRLWSQTDVSARHRRRYTRRTLVERARRTGFDVVTVTSFVSTLLPAMVASRLTSRLLRRPQDPVAALAPPVVNGLFERVLDGERGLIERGLSLPVGGSLILVGRKRR